MKLHGKLELYMGLMHSGHLASEANTLKPSRWLDLRGTQHNITQLQSRPGHFLLTPHTPSLGRINGHALHIIVGEAISTSSFHWLL
jgi:hypothetical protein